MAKKAAAAAAAAASPANGTAPPKTKKAKASVQDPSNPPKDEVALKEDAQAAGESNTSTPVNGGSSSGKKGKKAAAADGVKAVDGVTNSGRKVRIHEDSPSVPDGASKGAKTRRAADGEEETASASPVTAAAAAKKGGKKGKKTNGAAAADASMEAAGPAEASTSAAVDPKFSPKHKDTTRELPKSVLKKQKKRKADTSADDAEGDASAAAADESAAAEISAALDAADISGVEGEVDDDGELDFLAGFASGSDDDDEMDGPDSSDEEGEGAASQKERVSVTELPQASKTVAVTKAGSKKGGKGKKDEPGVIYLGRIPHGFFEEEMKSYFSQFGDVNRLRLSRNRATGASKHYAFIEFAHASVAEIVAETMNNYLLHGHILQCKIVPAEQVHPKMWIGANRKFRPIPKGRIERLKHNAPKTDEQKAQITTRLVKREQMKRDRLRELGIEYDFDGYAKTLPAKQLKDQKEEKKALDAAKKLEDQVKKDATAAPAKAKDAKKKGKGAKGAAAAPSDATPAASAEAKEPTRTSKRARKSI